MPSNFVSAALTCALTYVFLGPVLPPVLCTCLLVRGFCCMIAAPCFLNVTHAKTYWAFNAYFVLRGVCSVLSDGASSQR